MSLKKLYVQIFYFLYFKIRLWIDDKGLRASATHTPP